MVKAASAAGLMGILTQVNGRAASGPAAGQPMALTHYKATDTTGTQIRVRVVPGGDFEHKLIYSIELADLVPGEILSVMAQVEIESKIPTNVLCASHLVLSNAPTEEQGLVIAPATGTNIVNRPESGGVYQHYTVATNVGSLVIAEPTIRKFVNFFVYAACDADLPEAARVLLARPYAGSMTVLRFSAVG
jgi:hypothetical protein